MFTLSPDQLALQAKARALAADVIAPKAAEVDRTEQYPWDSVEQLTQAGFMGMTVPKALGGQGRSYLDTVLAVEEFAKVCGITARIVVEGNMGAIGALLAYGTPQQQRLAAQHVLSGDKPAICITEPGAGSAATDMTATAEQVGDGYVLNGMKHWITGGGVSRLHLIFARLVADGKDQGIAGFMAFRGQDAGLVIGEREPTMGLRGIPETRIYFKNLKLGPERIVVPPDGIKRGFAGLMNAYNSQRVGAATVALGLGQGAYEAALAYTKERKQFGRPIAEFQGVQWMLADLRIQLDAARLMVWRAAASAQWDGATFPDPLLAAEAKVIASETAIKATTDALQLHGALGYSRNLPLERMARDARMFTIGGGTAQMLRNLIGGRILGIKTPQTRAGYLRLAEGRDA
jgi:hypothetical protein